jgi:hypothetical protein
MNMAGLMQASLPPLPELEDDAFVQSAQAPLSDPKDYKPIIKLQDAPGVNGLPFMTKPWHIVVATSYLQAITTDQSVMTGNRGTTDRTDALISTKSLSAMAG